MTLRALAIPLALLLLPAGCSSSTSGTPGTGDGGSSANDAACTPDPTGACAGKCGQLSTCGQVVTCGQCGAGQACGGGGANLCGTASCTGSCAGKACGASDGCDSVCTTACVDGG